MSVALFYFVKKKVTIADRTRAPLHANTGEVLLDLWVFPQKPKYQPQLQMIQMVGPNDNDYIYINFKNFEYDTKWEFPRENLELGMIHTRRRRSATLKLGSAENEDVGVTRALFVFSR